MKRYTIIAQRARFTSVPTHRGLPATEYRSSIGLPQFDIICETIQEALHKAHWILDTRRDPTILHTFTVTDGDNVWDERGKKL